MRNAIKSQRLAEKLNNELGPIVLSYLSDPDVLEVALNCDGKLWIKHLVKGYVDTEEQMDASNAHQLLGSIADAAHAVLNEKYSRIVTELPHLGYRFVGFLQPTTKSPAFIIRKPCNRVFTLEEYIEQDVLDYQQVEAIQKAICFGNTFLIAGGPGTGKTTFANTLLEEMVEWGNPCQRLIIIEETRELNCSAPNTLYLKTSECADHEALLKGALLASPDKIIVGECKGKEMLTLLKAWNTGTHGGLTTIHGNNARSSLQRVRDLAEEAGSIPSPYLISESIKVIIALDFNAKGRRIVKEIVEVRGFEDGDYVLQKI